MKRAPLGLRPARRPPCPGCGRPRWECKVMPCLYLERLWDAAEAGYPEALQQWAKEAGGRIVRRA